MPQTQLYGPYGLLPSNQVSVYKTDCLDEVTKWRRRTSKPDARLGYGLTFEVMRRLHNFLLCNTVIPSRCSIDTANKSAYTTEFLDTLNDSL
jgi:hypothetical protein